MIAGNFSLNGELTNLAQYDISTGVWSNNYDVELFVYGESYGVIWDVAVNRSNPSDQLIVVGTFDAISKTSQAQYCGVGVWTGLAFNKVGEGLCPRGGSEDSVVSLHSLVLGDHGDLYVGGSFESRVWNGKEFVSVFDLAYYRGSRAAWLPLEGGRLLCDTTLTPGCQSRVSALEWDSTHQILYIGGRFDMIDDRKIPGGLCMWTEATGIIPLEGSLPGLGLSPELPNGEVVSLAYEQRSQSLFVAGSFYYVNGSPCTAIAVWNRRQGTWTCLYQENKGISTVTAMTYDAIANKLYLAGWASIKSQWHGSQWGSPYAISVADLNNFIEQFDPNYGTTQTPTPSPTKKSSKFRSHSIFQSSKKQSHSATTIDQRILQNSISHPRNQQTMTKRHPPRAKTASLSSLHNRSHSIGIKQELYFQQHKHNHTVSQQHHQTRQQSSSRKLPSLQINWDWLPGFSGGNGPIFGLALGRESYKDCLFIAGAFNNGPPVVIWIPASQTASGTDTVIPLGSQEDGINGLVTSVVQLIIPVPHVTPLGPPVEPVHNLSWPNRIAFLVMCILVSTIVVLFAIKFIQISHDRTSGVSDREGGEGEEEGGSGGVYDGTPQIPLVTLGGRDDIDLQQCFRNALRARHLIHCDNLQVIPIEEVTLLKVIGEGTFGRVWSALRRNTDVAVKEFVFAQTAITGGSQQINEIIEEIIGEACVMSCLNHPKILTLYGVSLTGQALWIVSELCEKGSLRMLLNDPTFPLTFAQKLSFCLDIADGMMYLHQRKCPIIHRDLKTHNIFLVESSGNLIAKIGDWGSARVIALSNERSLTQGVGTACWLSPEVILNARYSKASDVYAFGIVLWEIYTRQDVYPRLSAPQIIARVANEGLRPSIPYNCPLEELMKSCWNQNPALRPPFAKIIAKLAELYTRAPRTVDSRPSPSAAPAPAPMVATGQIGVEDTSKDED